MGGGRRGSQVAAEELKAFDEAKTAAQKGSRRSFVEVHKELVTNEKEQATRDKKLGLDKEPDVFLLKPWFRELFLYLIFLGLFMYNVVSKRNSAQLFYCTRTNPFLLMFCRCADVAEPACVLRCGRLGPDDIRLLELHEH